MITRIRFALGLARAIAHAVVAAIAARVRGDLELHITLTAVEHETVRDLMRRFRERFGDRMVRFGFGGDSDRAWRGGGQVKPLGDPAGARQMLEEWSRATLPQGSTFRVTRMGRRAIG